MRDGPGGGRKYRYVGTRNSNPPSIPLYLSVEVMLKVAASMKQARWLHTAGTRACEVACALGRNDFMRSSATSRNLLHKDMIFTRSYALRPLGLATLTILTSQDD